MYIGFQLHVSFTWLLTASLVPHCYDTKQKKGTLCYSRDMNPFISGHMCDEAKA